MDSKRKAPVLAAEIESRTPKRYKSDAYSHPLLQGETAETTTEYGMKLLDTVKRTQDKSKRLVATNFLTLPSKRELPHYYEHVKLPVALDTIETKLSRRELPNLSALESLFKRMVTNAKSYNQQSSEIWQDAERLRKVLSSFMKENNPAYKLDANYVAQSLPIPGEEATAEDLAHDSDIDAEGEPDTESLPATPMNEPVVVSAPRGRGRPRGSLNRVVNDRRSSTTPAFESPYSGRGYMGLNFQQAQEKIVYDLLAETESHTNELKFEVFIELPPKALKDYYKVIPNPASLKTMLKQVKGASPFRSWKSYEDEFSLIWKNACHYNEDGSEINNLAKQLEASFYVRLAMAKQDVVEPGQGQKIKLKLGPDPTTGHQKITLRLPGKASPAVSPPATANGSAINGTQQRHFATSQSSTPVPNIGTPNRATSASVASPGFPPAVSFKHEEAARPSPVPAYPSSNIPQLQNGHQSYISNPQVGNLMPPPSTPGLSNYYSTSQYTTNAYGQNSYNQNAALGLDSRWRQPGKDDSDSLIEKVNLSTHPDLNIPRHFRMDVLPSPNTAHQSVTLSLPSTHYYVQVVPAVARHVATRQHKLFLTVNGQRLHAVPKVQGSGIFDREQSAYVARFLPGVNKIEVEVIAALPKGTAKVNESDVELEKFVIFVNLLK